MRYLPQRQGFLHPVLGQRDYNWPNGTFSPVVTSRLITDQGKSLLSVDADFTLTVEAINQLIDRDEAVCAVWVYCPNTAYRKLLQAKGGNRRKVVGTIETQYLRSTVDLHPQVLARTRLRLNLKEAHTAYGDGWCEIPSGAPLATHPYTRTKILDDDRPVRGMFVLTICDKYGRGWHVQAETRRPEVILRADKETNNWFETKRQQELLWAEQTLYPAALTETLTVWLREWTPDKDWVEGGWCSTIEQKLTDSGIAVKAAEEGGTATFSVNDDYISPTWVAQRLLGYPLQQLTSSVNGEDENQ
ncbi:MAG: hypothetical protein OXH33_01345 [bacterium]|nr:hypothetical protein [bacterium]